MEKLAHAFGDGDPFTLGVEEELFLVDPLTGTLINSSEGVLAQVDVPHGEIEKELHACQVELITEVLSSAGEVAAALGAARAAVLDTGTGLLGAGTHPSAGPTDAEITDKERYERIRDLLGDAALTPVSGLHVHVGMPDPETAIRVFNGLRNHLPLLTALSANSPFRHRRDSGLASAREMTLRGWPRSGVPRALADFADFTAMADALTDASGVPDYTWFWWKLRPHPRLGTVEIRALDTQTSVVDTAALAGLVHCLARGLADADPQDGLAPEILQESVFRASRFGVGADLIDLDGRHRPVPELLDRVLDEYGEHAAALGASAVLEPLAQLVADGGGAGRQRALHSVMGIDALTRRLTAETATVSDRS